MKIIGGSVATIFLLVALIVANISAPLSSDRREEPINERQVEERAYSHSNQIGSLLIGKDYLNMIQLLEKQQLRIEELEKGFEAQALKISELTLRIERENGLGNSIAENTDQNSSSDPSADYDISSPDEFLASYENDFNLLEQDFYSQGIDPEWNDQMQQSFSDVEETLNDYASGNIYIEEQECRTSSCRMVLVNKDATQLLHPVLLSADGSTSFQLKNFSENGESKTLVMYKR
jgi:hypothetical protein